MEIRLATPSDMPDILALWRTSGLAYENWVRVLLQRAIAQRTGEIWVAVEDDVVAASVWFCPYFTQDGEEGRNIAYSVVDPMYKNQRLVYDIYPVGIDYVHNTLGLRWIVAASYREWVKDFWPETENNWYFDDPHDKMLQKLPPEIVRLDSVVSGELTGPIRPHRALWEHAQAQLKKDT